MSINIQMVVKVSFNAFNVYNKNKTTTRKSFSSNIKNKGRLASGHDIIFFLYYNKYNYLDLIIQKR